MSAGGGLSTKLMPPPPEEVSALAFEFEREGGGEGETELVEDWGEKMDAPVPPTAAAAPGELIDCSRSQC